MFDPNQIKLFLAQDDRILAAYLLGSAVSGRIRSDSDFDIAYAALRHPIESVCRANQYEPPVICALLELMEQRDETSSLRGSTLCS